MGWIVERTRGDEYEVICGHETLEEWRKSGSLPRVYNERFKALHRMYVEQSKDPDWNYEVAEYLR